MSEEQSTYSANPGKQLVRTVDGVDYQRIPVKTHLITNTDDMADVVVRYAKDRMQEGDILFISEKAVACTQNRAIPMEDIKPRKLAVTLSRYVTKTPAGIGLGIPETMEMALRECGTLRILFQQGEETLKGALAVIDAGVIEDVDIALGLHIRPVQDIAYGEMSPAVRHASSTFVNVVINGLSSHGARPHLGVNAIEAAAVAINAITAIKINPIIPWSCKVTGIKGGGVAPNIIPDKVEMIVDARAQTNEAMTELLEKLRRAVTNAAAALGATAEVTTPGGVIPAAEYDDELTAEVTECIVEVVGEEKLAKELVNPGGEDFHYFVNKYPHIKAAYFGVGAAAAPGLHHQDMQLNKEALPSGTAVLVKMVERKLG